jgi:hypothetical protein
MFAALIRLHARCCLLCAEVLALLNLGGHLKTGHRGSPKIRPTESGQGSPAWRRESASRWAPLLSPYGPCSTWR